MLAVKKIEQSNLTVLLGLTVVVEGVKFHFWTNFIDHFILLGPTFSF